MIRRKSLWIGLMLILALCCIPLVIILTSPQGQVAAAPSQITPTSITRNLGLPAIHPSLSTTSTIQITTADVQAYLNTHHFAGGPMVPGAVFNIVSIQFMTSTQASVLMKGEETGLAATAPVCYVKLHGPFTMVAPTASGAEQLSTIAEGVEIFDAQTGNLLMWWVPSV